MSATSHPPPRFAADRSARGDLDPGHDDALALLSTKLLPRRSARPPNRSARPPNRAARPPSRAARPAGVLGVGTIAAAAVAVVGASMAFALGVPAPGSAGLPQLDAEALGRLETCRRASPASAAAAEVRVAWTVSPDGSVTDVAVEGAGQEVAACLRQAAASLRLAPRRRAASTSLVLPAR
ncbi:MAG: hypothetical protein ACFCGT_01030 [Sandaracinaceae bacterium]